MSDMEFVVLGLALVVWAVVVLRPLPRAVERKESAALVALQNRFARGGLEVEEFELLVEEELRNPSPPPPRITDEPGQVYEVSSLPQLFVTSGQVKAAFGERVDADG